MRYIIILSLALFLAGCGGGGSSARPTLAGNFSNLSGMIGPDPAHSTEQPTITLSADFTGALAPAASSFSIPFTVTRDGVAGYAQGTMTFQQISGPTGSGDYTGNGTLTLPTQPIGSHTYDVTLQPGVNYLFTGTGAQGQATLTVVADRNG